MGMVEENRQLAPSVVAELLRDGMKRGQRPYLTITSGSMRPLLHIGDEVQLEPVYPAELQVGDIVTVVAPVTLLTHRFYGWIEREGENWLLTRGDRFLTFDSLWHPEHLVGRVFARRRQHQRLLLRGEGRSGWIGRHVAHIAAAEGHLFSPPNTPEGLPSPPLPRQSASSLLVVQIRRLIYLWITLVVGLLGSKSKSRKEKS